MKKLTNILIDEESRKHGIMPGCGDCSERLELKIKISSLESQLALAREGLEFYEVMEKMHPYSMQKIATPALAAIKGNR